MSSQIKDHKRKGFQHKAKSLASTAHSEVEPSKTSQKKLDITSTGKPINFSVWQISEYKKAVSKYGADVAGVIMSYEPPVVKVQPLPPRPSVTEKALHEHELKAAITESKNNKINCEKLFADLIKEESMTARSLDAIKRIVMGKKGYILAYKPIIIQESQVVSTSTAVTTGEEIAEIEEGAENDDESGERNIDSEDFLVDDWEDVLLRCDAVRLMKRIRASHLGGGSSVNPIATQITATTEFEKILQKPSESLLAYKERFESDFKNLKAIGAKTTYTPEKLGLKFLMTLSDDLNQFKQHIWMQVNAKDPKYRTVADIYSAACNFHIISSTGKLIEAHAYTVKATGKAAASQARVERKKIEKEPSYGKRVSGQNNKFETGKEKKDKVGPKCEICKDGSYHPYRDCPIIKRAQDMSDASENSKEKKKVMKSKDDDDNENNFYGDEIVNYAYPIKLSLSSYHANNTDEVLCDSGSTIHIFSNANLVQDISEVKPIYVKGISGDTVKVNHQGRFMDFHEVYVSTEISEVNILSLAKMQECCSVSIATDGFKIYPDASNDSTIKQSYYFFKNSGDGLYIFTVPHYHNSFLVGYGPATVAANRSRFNGAQLKRAEMAKEFLKRMGYPSIGSANIMIQNKSIQNLPITVDDLENALAIYGPDLATIRGKTCKLPALPLLDTPIPRLIESRIELFIDIMIIDGHKFLVSVCSFGFAATDDLGRETGARATANIRRSLAKQIEAFQSRRFDVTRLNIDPEPGLIAAANSFADKGISVNIVGTNSHVPIVERRIREIKERVRGFINTLPYKLSPKLLVFLVLFCSSRVNLVPHKACPGRMSPAEVFRGATIDYRKDLRCGFGEYVEAIERSSNDMVSRTAPCITLLPTANTSGSWFLLHLATNRIIRRDQWVAKPMNAVIIGLLNNLATTANYDPTNDIDIQAEPPKYATPPLPPTVIDVTDPTADLPLRPPIQPSDPQPDILPDDTAPPPLDPAPPTDVVPGPVSGVQDYDTPQRRSSRLAEQGGTMQYKSIERGAGPVPQFARVNNISVKRALKDFPDETRAAARKEMQQMLAKGVLRFVKPEHNRSNHRRFKPIKTFMFIKIKYRADGSFEKVKARLVANGPQQDPRSYTDDDCASPTAGIPFVFTILAIAAQERRHYRFVDITGAYLNAHIEDLNIYVTIDPFLTTVLLELRPDLTVFAYSDGTLLAKLERALYGTHEASLRWYTTLTLLAEKHGFIKNSIDPCVLNKIINSVQVTIVIYVDDILITCVDKSLVNTTVDMLRAEFKEITVHDEDINSYLGMTFQFVEDSVKVTMDGFIKQLFEDIEVIGTTTTPAANYLFDVDPMSVLLSDEKAKYFHSTVMRMMYLAKRVRPDILLPISFLSTRVSRCTEEDMKKLNRVLKYINGTKDMGIVLKALPDFLHAFIDASYGVHQDAKGHSGLFLTIGRGPFIVASSKQKINAKSSYEAEIIALSDKCSNVIWMREFLLAQGIQMGPAKVREDNQSTIVSVMKGRGTSERTKHIKVRQFWMKGNVDEGDMVFVHTPTENMIADILTKPLQGEMFTRLRKALLNWP